MPIWTWMAGISQIGFFFVRAKRDSVVLTFKPAAWGSNQGNPSDKAGDDDAI